MLCALATAQDGVYHHNTMTRLLLVSLIDTHAMFRRSCCCMLRSGANRLGSKAQSAGSQAMALFCQNNMSLVLRHVNCHCADMKRAYKDCTYKVSRFLIAFTPDLALNDAVMPVSPCGRRVPVIHNAYLSFSSFNSSPRSNLLIQKLQ